MKVAKDCVVSIDFRLTNDRDELLDESGEGTPLVYLHGAAGVVPALQAGLEGKAPGDAFSVSLTPEEGFGDHDPARVVEISRSLFATTEELEPGVAIEIQAQAGIAAGGYVVKAVSDSTVTLDGNHPLAGMHLTFAGQVVDVRPATAEEVAEGHPL